MKLVLDPTAKKPFFLAVIQGMVFGVSMDPDAMSALVASGFRVVEARCDSKGRVYVGQAVVGQLVDQAGRPTSPDVRRSWKLLRPDGHPGRLGAAIKRAVREGILSRGRALQFLAWIGCPTPEATLRKLGI